VREITGKKQYLLPFAALGAAIALLLTVGGAPALSRTTSEEPTIGSVGCYASGHTSIDFQAAIDPELLETEWSLSYSTTKGGPWTPVPGGSGTITQAEAVSAEVHAGPLTVSPGATYYVLATAKNADGSVSEESGKGCEATPLHPSPGFSGSPVRNVTATTAHLSGSINPNQNAAEIHWRLEYSTAEAGGFKVVPGGSGAVSQAEVEAVDASQALEEGLVQSFPQVQAGLTGLSPSTRYYVRLVAESEPEFPEGSGKKLHETATSEVESFATSGPPVPVTFATHALDGEEMRALGSVNPESVPTSGEQSIALDGTPTGGTFTLSFKGQSTGATGTGDLAGGSASGSGDLSAATGLGRTTIGSKIITDVQTETGSFAVGQTIATPTTHNVVVFPANATITAVGAGTLTISTAALNEYPEVRLQAGSDVVTGLVTSSGAFAVGQRISGAGIPGDAVVAAVGSGALTLSEPVLAPGSGVALTGTPDVITDLAGSTGAFTVGEAISGPGIPAGTTITKIDPEAGVLRLSADTTVAGTGVALTAGLPYNASGETVARALKGLSGAPELGVEGPAGGPWTVFFDEGDAGVGEPQIVGDGSGLSPVGAGVSVVTLDRGGEGDEAHYRFQYVSQAQFGEGGWADAAETPQVDLGFGDSPEVVGQDLPGLEAGETYRYRILVENQAGAAQGQEQTLTVPASVVESSSVSCPNEALRSGPSASLPDCRAYEQVTPVEKHGSPELFNYGTEFGASALVGADGEHVMVSAQFADWAGGSDPGQSPYFFSRTAAGWQMTAASPEPATGVARPETQIFSPDLTSFAFESGYVTGAGSGESPNVEFKAGPPGGPYAAVSVPRSEVGPPGSTRDGWVASSEDFSKLILQVEDHELLGEGTGTKSGPDLYEYVGGELRQANVNSEGETIGKCGAEIVKGYEGGEGGLVSSPHAVSANGSRVFFYADPTGPCLTPEEIAGGKIDPNALLYVRVNGSETVDLGAYKFLAANGEGTKVLLEKRGSGEAREVVLYEAESGDTKPLFSTNQESHLAVSEDLNVVYFEVPESLTAEAPPASVEFGTSSFDLYRYDISTETLSFVVQTTSGGAPKISPDGRYAYFEAPPPRQPSGTQGAAGVPGGGVFETGGGKQQSSQVYRYDDVEDAIECISCASSFDPEPKLSAFIGGNIDSGRTATQNAMPAATLASANGEFAFFSTASALVPADVDGEIVPVTAVGGGDPEGVTSPSSDIYEWRRQGVDGCTHVQGCLALITNGRGGYFNRLLGTADEGRDVFFYTSSQLVPADRDTAGDIYDARVDGGFAPAPPGPVECEGDACSTPQSPPVDSTPASFTFTGAGNIVQPAAAPATKPVVRSTKPKPKKKTGKKHKKGRKQTRGKREEARRRIQQTTGGK
jgi:hypothetical protein